VSSHGSVTLTNAPPGPGALPLRGASDAPRATHAAGDVVGIRPADLGARMSVSMDPADQPAESGPGEPDSGGGAWLETLRVDLFDE